MHSLFKKQRGYFGIVLALLILTIAFTSLVISYGLANKAFGVTYSLMSIQSYFMARSGLQRAVYEITAKNVVCTAINGTANFTNATFPNSPGAFTVTAAQSIATSTLNGALTATNITSLTLTSATSFANQGTIQIENELITYTSKSGNVLSTLTRGAGGTTAAAHATAVSVTQNQCSLTSIGGVPNVTSAVTQRTLVEVLIGASFSIGKTATGAGTGAGTSTGAGSKIFQTTLVGTSTTNLRNNSFLSNRSVLLTTATGNYSGSNSISIGDYSYNNSPDTYVSNGAGGLVASTTVATSPQPDVLDSTSAYFTSTTLLGKFFNASEATILAASTTVNALGLALGVTNAMLRYGTGAANTITTTTAIGSATSPVILIVDGNLTISGNVTINGFLYVLGTLTITATTAVINGAAAAEGAISIRNNSNINYNPGILNLAANIAAYVPYRITPYSFISSSIQEQFS